MTLFQKLRSLALAALMLGAAYLIYTDPIDSCALIIAILGIIVFTDGFNLLCYFAAMARHMVGGRLVLYKGMIYASFGLFTLTLADDSKQIIILYLVGVYALSGLIDILRSVEARSQGASYMLARIRGISSFLIAFICIFYFRHTRVLALIYCAGLVYSALLRIYDAFRRSAIVYIP